MSITRYLIKHNSGVFLMSNEQAQAQIQIPAPVRGFADAIKPQLRVEGGKIPIPAEAFEQSLPEGISIQTVKTVQNHLQNFSRGLDVAIGEVSIEHMAQNPEVDTVYVKTKLGADTYSAAVDRTRNVPAGVGAGRKDVWGHLTSGLQPAGGSTKKAVVSHLQMMGANILNKG